MPPADPYFVLTYSSILKILRLFFLTMQVLYTNLTGEKNVLPLYIKHFIIPLVGLLTHFVERIQASHVKSSINWYLFLCKLILFDCCKNDAVCKTNVVH